MRPDGHAEAISTDLIYFKDLDDRRSDVAVGKIEGGRRLAPIDFQSLPGNRVVGPGNYRRAGEAAPSPAP